MALLRPSLTLVLDLDERLASEESVQEIKRDYAHIGTPVIRTHAPAADGTPPVNVARFRVGMGTYRYLHSVDEGSDARWHEIVEPWIGSMLHKVGNNMKVFNDRQRTIDLPEIAFGRIDIELQGGELVIGVRPDPTSMVDPAFHTQVGRARTLFNEGALARAVRIDMPPDDEYERQRTRAWDGWIAEHPEALEPAPEAPPKPAPEPQPEKSPEQLLREDIEAKSYENTAVAPTDSNTLPPVDRQEEAEEPERFTFAVSYVLWDITFSDGSRGRFDSSTLAFVEQSS